MKVQLSFQRQSSCADRAGHIKAANTLDLEPLKSDPSDWRAPIYILKRDPSVKADAVNVVIVASILERRQTTLGSSYNQGLQILVFSCPEQLNR